MSPHPLSRSRILRVVTGAGLAAAFLAASSAPALAATCLEQTRELAERHNLETDTPTLDQGSGIDTDDLAESGGVIEPPATGDTAVIVPPETDSDMATVPDIEPDVEPPSDEAAGGLTPSDSAILQSLLTAARAEAEREREEECFERLGEARQFVARQQE